ncbi:sortilin-like [Diadema setosum]|uniref:sortilin-like n=1 Tax=Diadema setosum TaxID=31175 RepID=UPI003B3B2B42
MNSYVFISLFLVTINFRIGSLYTLTPKVDNDVVYFSQDLSYHQKTSHSSLPYTRTAYGHKAADVDVGVGEQLLPRSRGDVDSQASASGQFTPRRRNARAAIYDGNCGVTGDQIGRIHNNKFHLNDSNFNLALIWTGQDSKELLALTTLELGFLPAPSHLWLSLDYGKTFSNVDSRIDGAIIRANNGIFKSPLDPGRIILVSYKYDMDVFRSDLFISKDGARSFQKVSVDFYPEGKIAFHPTNPDVLFVRAPRDEMKLWLSQDFGVTWRMLKSHVEQAAWATKEMQFENLLFILQYKDSGETLQLMRTANFGSSYTTLQKGVRNFGVQGNFIYAAVDSKENPSEQHLLHVSNDQGNTWQPTQLPAITSDRFFSVLDMSEGLIFMHVDDPGNTGTGTIYTSASDGIVFSESLQRHLFPNGGQITDFYRVESMRGVYFASQIHPDSTIHTMITYDRGGIWTNIRQPKDVPCNDQGICSLQIHNRYSQLKGIHFPSGPISHSTATGLIIAHATVANGLEVREPDVYVSSDGGYNWRLALLGPHHYAITNSGGLMVAIPTSDPATDTIKFSYDEGQCWNSYTFSDEPVTVTGLLPEPSRKSLNVSIWGYGVDTEWRSFMIDFSSILGRECTNQDFVEWKPHEDNDYAGCLLGLKESFRRVRPDALCRVNFNFEQVAVSTEHCTCQKADYECDFGFYRPNGSEDCVRSPDMETAELEYCENGHEEELSSWGYRKIPGDVCKGGYQPQRNVEQLKAKCEGGTSSKKHKAAVGILITFLVLAVLVIAFIVYRKQKWSCVQQRMRAYQYSQLSQGDSFDSKALDIVDTMPGYHDDSDEDMLD